ncbi:MAG: TlpA family protein disulfide reductase [Sphingobacteriales bacterium]|nr:MAG: TlpA family protein disulfide reductase [Sphingobacteriales bacterium]
MKKIQSTLLMAIVLPIATLILFCKSAQAQPALAPGEDAPDISFSNFYKSGRGSISLRNNGKKLVILDYWSTWCKSCIKALPKLALLQEQFKSEIDIIAITDQDADLITKFFKRTALNTGSLTIKTDDSISQKYFPYQSLPHSVWIRNGKVLYITYGYNVNAAVIEKVLRGKRPILALKDGEKVYDDNAALWAEENKHFSLKPSHYSYIGGWLNDYGGRIQRGFVDSTTNSVGIRMINVSLNNLILTAYGDQFKYANRVIMERTASAYVVWENKFMEEDQRREKNMVCYEIKVPLSRQQHIPAYIAADLNRYLDFDIVLEKRLVTCYVIEQRRGAMIPICREADRATSKKAGRVYFCGNFSSFVMRLQKECAYDPMPIIDRSGYEGSIMINVAGKIGDIELVKKILYQHGFEMKEKEVELEMLVLKDRKPALCSTEVPDL